MNDFSKRRAKSEFIAWLHAWMQDKDSLDKIGTLFVRNNDDKRMYEEALSIYNYVRRWHRDEVAIELPGDSGSADGIIYDPFGEIMEYVQVTLPVETADHVTRKKLATTGLSVADRFSPGDSIGNYADTVSRVIERKLGYAYEDGTVLLVPLSADMVLEEESRFEAILRRLRPIPSEHRFRRIIVMDYLGKFQKQIA